MTATEAPPARPGPARPPSRRRLLVDVLVCGSRDRGDDGAALLAADLLRGGLPPDVRLRRVGQLDVDHLLSVPGGAGVVILDTATGIPCGTVHELPLHGAFAASAPIRPRSSHALAIPEVVGLADMMRGRPLVGSIVVVGGRQFGLGRPLSPTVARALPRLAQVVRTVCDRIRDTLTTDAAAPLAVGGV